MTDANDTELRRTAERRADMKIGFRTHLLTYLLVNGGLFAINLLTSPGHWWFYWPMIGWGVGLAAHFASTYVDLGADRERMVQAEIERLRRRP